MIVYRVVDKSGHGIFYGGTVWDAEETVAKAYPNSPKPSRHPCPEKDLVLRPQWQILCKKQTERDWNFGFLNPEQMFDWFDSKEIRRELMRQGAKIQEIKVTRANYYVKAGLFQCVFRKDMGTVQATRTFADYVLHSTPTNFPKPDESDESWEFARPPLVSENCTSW
jgi:hypothetical protein